MKNLKIREKVRYAKKPYKGKIVALEKVVFPKDIVEQYPTNLGYIYRCNYLDHPYFRGLEAFGGHTSLVVSEHKRSDGTIGIETLNSRYSRDRDLRWDNR